MLPVLTAFPHLPPTVAPPPVSDIQVSSVTRISIVILASGLRLLVRPSASAVPALGLWLLTFDFAL